MVPHQHPPAAGVIFDFDGVLVDTEPLHEAALRAAVEPLGMRFTREAYLDRYVGFDDRDALALIARDHGRSLDEHQTRAVLDAKWHAVESAIDAGRVRAFDGTLALLRDAIASRNAGHAGQLGQPHAVSRIAICSGATRREILRILARVLGCGPADSAWPFDALVTADEVAKAKPDPAGYARTAHLLGLAPAACVTLEDTPKGIAAARAAGVRVVGVAHTLGLDHLARATGPGVTIVASSRDLTLAAWRSAPLA
jgi:beta-phosphoglucomutase